MSICYYRPDLEITSDIQKTSNKREDVGEIEILHSKISEKMSFPEIGHGREWKVFLDCVASDKKVYLVYGYNVLASEILYAVAEGKNIDITYAIIDGDLDTRKAGVTGITNDLIISNSVIKGNVNFGGTVFGKDTRFALKNGTRGVLHIPQKSIFQKYAHGTILSSAL